MGLYLGLTLLWALGAGRASWTRPALAAAVAFNGGLAAGRLLGLTLDGWVPSLASFAAFEGSMALTGAWLLRRGNAPSA
jgi:hypothetical protein